jgi:hypothetical protein
MNKRSISQMGLEEHRIMRNVSLEKLNCSIIKNLADINFEKLIHYDYA